jgi:hypothetical protein
MQTCGSGVDRKLRHELLQNESDNDKDDSDDNNSNQDDSRSFPFGWLERLCEAGHMTAGIRKHGELL